MVKEIRLCNNILTDTHKSARGGEGLAMNCEKNHFDAKKASPLLLSADNVNGLFDSVDVFLFDLDGVIWKGDTLIDGVPQTLELLRAKGKNCVFVTNSSTKTREYFAQKLISAGVNVTEDEVLTASFATAMYLKATDFPREKKIYVIGEEGMMEELELAGFTALGGPEDGNKTVQLNSDCIFNHDKNVGAVVVGRDIYISTITSFSEYGTICIRENPGCLFIATNRDAVGHYTSQEWPGGGCMVAAICGSTQKEPVVVGKPSTFMVELLQHKFKVDTSRMCMVGDRLDTDILFGVNAGCKTLVVLSGVTTISSVQDPSNNIQPDYYTNTVSDIYKLLGQ